MRVSSAPCIMIHISDEKIAEALRRSKGNISNAAKCLKCTRKTIYARVEKNEEFRAILEEGREILVDLAETQLEKNVKAGDQRAIEFTLRSLGKRRGWNPTVTVAGEDGGPIIVKVLKGASLDDL